MDSTRPANHDANVMHSLLQTGGHEELAAGSVAAAPTESAAS